MKKRLIILWTILCLVILYHTSVFASAYGGTPSSGTQTPVQNPHSQGSSQIEGGYGTYGSNSSTVIQSPYVGPYGSDIGNNPSHNNRK